MKSSPDLSNATMRSHTLCDVDVAVAAEGAPLVDLTQPLTIKSKRTERLRKKLQKKTPPAEPVQGRGFFGLPWELLIDIIGHLRPRDVFALARVCKPLHAFIANEEACIADIITNWRYPILARCLPHPALLDTLDEPAGRVMLSLRGNQKPLYQHIPPPDASLLCTCLSCLLRWNSLCAALDFRRWQDHLDFGKAIPLIERGDQPGWNTKLLAKHAAMVLTSIQRPLWYARILELHLESITRSIRRHSANKGNRRTRFQMTREDVRAETDAFLAGRGPSTVEIPYHRDNYYMLEAYLPHRCWSADRKRWIYIPPDQHEKDVQRLLEMVQQASKSQTLRDNQSDVKSDVEGKGDGEAERSSGGVSDSEWKVEIQRLLEESL